MSDEEKLAKKIYMNSYNSKIRDRQKRNRLEALIHYSQDPPSCKCCGESAYEFLAIDHIFGRTGPRKANIGSWLKRNGYPDGFQVLCHNCNLAKGFYGLCPHRRDSSVGTESKADTSI